MFTTDQLMALEKVASGRNIFLSGEAGTGKSYVVNEVKRRSEAEHKNLLIMAPTGMAAINVGGTTMHRALKLPVHLITPEDYEKKKKAPKVLRHADCVIVDEISMCRKDQFNYFGYMIGLANKWREKKHKPPIQLLLVGDFHQLPPVVTENDRAIYEAAYGEDIGDGFAFTSPYWQSLNIETVTLRENVRQSGNSSMQEALTKIRHGDAFGITYFNQNALRTVPGEYSIVVTALKRKVEQINAEKLNALSAPLYQSQAVVQSHIGEMFSPEQIPAESNFLVKVGARVMTTINDTERDAWQNGSIGTVTGIEENFHCPQKITVQFDNGATHVIEPHTWDIKDYAYNSDTKQIEEVTLGSIKQFPLRLAYAITIHKSQGATFDDMTLDPYCFAKGQLYVALSRCRDINGLHLTRPIAERDLRTSMEVETFYRDSEPEYLTGEEHGSISLDTALDLSELGY